MAPHPFEATAKAITVAQPWAALILSSAKTILDRPAPPKGPMCPEGTRGLPGCSLTRSPSLPRREPPGARACGCGKMTGDAGGRDFARSF